MRTGNRLSASQSIGCVPAGAVRAYFGTNAFKGIGTGRGGTLETLEEMGCSRHAMGNRG